MANQTKLNNIRMCIPPIAVCVWINSAMTIIHDYIKETQKMNDENIPYMYLAPRSMTQSRENFKNSSFTNIVETPNLISIIIPEKCG